MGIELIRFHDSRKWNYYLAERYYGWGEYFIFNGEIVEVEENYDDDDDGDSGYDFGVAGEFTSVAEMNEDWEKYKENYKSKNAFYFDKYFGGEEMYDIVRHWDSKELEMQIEFLKMLKSKAEAQQKLDTGV